MLKTNKIVLVWKKSNKNRNNFLMQIALQERENKSEVETVAEATVTSQK